MFQDHRIMYSCNLKNHHLFVSLKLFSWITVCYFCENGSVKKSHVIFFRCLHGWKNICKREIKTIFTHRLLLNKPPSIVCLRRRNFQDKYLAWPFTMLMWGFSSIVILNILSLYTFTFWRFVLSIEFHDNNEYKQNENAYQQIHVHWSKHIIFIEFSFVTIMFISEETKWFLVVISSCWEVWSIPTMSKKRRYKKHIEKIHLNILKGRWLINYSTRK